MGFAAEQGRLAVGPPVAALAGALAHGAAAEAASLAGPGSLRAFTIRLIAPDTLTPAPERRRVLKVNSLRLRLKTLEHSLRN